MTEDRIYGIHPVREALLGGKKLERILLRKGMDSLAAAQIMNLARQCDVPVQFVPFEKINHMVSNRNHQGVVAILSQLDYVSLEEAVATAQTKGKYPTVLLLDGVSDVRNFGAIARTCECAGAGALILPAKGGAAVNQDAIRTSAGALLRIPTCKVSNLRIAIFYLRESGFTIIGTAVEQNKTIYEADFRRPLALIMGAEGRGISRGILELCDQLVSIPQLGEIGSLNVSAAAAVVLFEAVRQRMNK
ncbi:MAG: 23S rRNA (guanosine(2251)-2'-O)-methyltransferase RlmB [Bacteroidales bacterium]|nr:23S rRNA (guanosine(2251)-2'-O)-methyltransferase RlmB [Bacteroidales bacterium]MDD2264499.1 23S rRNA (guanosine(2251)-2'-O)-methyltransferase RlmB [Bacteroidales bacterium]MDD2831734.1 23S rRNA (guanosine(2251)-2'-O)-methyltransferase RlmB [Bacteroidales bacterium]MDD3208961.1 23S rRNA (guanosine(2251)-2'-O)-methyltransferase RlmB [Bacteroidales bacterium]MDD3697667.1 23S rRNA (guanosine(2251)-2'-O)-methyltransferase RlmB [Bacteroidales bacterium]